MMEEQRGTAQDAQVSEKLQRGRDAIRRYAWREAFELLTEADEIEGLPPEDLEALGEAGWWTARLDAAISARERAHAAYLEAGNKRGAAMAAIALTRDYFGKGSPSIAKGWIGRAERLLAEEPDCVEKGHLARTRAVIALEGQKDYPASLEESDRAYELAERFTDRDLLALSIHDRGRALVAMGKVDEGWDLMDEATVAAVSGELSPWITGAVYCNTVTICKDLADFRRAGEWTEAAKRWCDRQSIAGFPGLCRVYRAGVMLVSGAWPEAEREARAACAELANFNLDYHAEAFYELGEIRMHVGDLPAAEEAFAQANELGRDPQPGLAHVRLKQGRTEAATANIERALQDAVPGLDRARFLPAFVEIAIASGRTEDAANATEELGEVAETFTTTALRAAAACARGKVALATGDAGKAQEELRQGRRLWQESGAPYEAARARLELARAYRSRGDDDAAGMELDAAIAIFERLGASLDLEEATEQLGSVGGPSRPSIRGSKTFMFTDIAGSTDLLEAIGDDAWHDVVRWHDQTLRSLFASHGGHEVDHAGDGFFVAFEDSVSAIECAVAIQRRLREQRRSQGFAPQVRIGLHRDEATHSGSGYTGRGVHLAARVAGTAPAGAIVASHETVSELNLRFATTEPQPVTLKGVTSPVEIVDVEWT